MNSGRGVVLEEAVVVTFGFRGEKTADSHRNGTSDQFCKTSHDDQLRLSQRRKTGSESEWNRQTVR
jgi:hypothetical protein